MYLQTIVDQTNRIEEKIEKEVPIIKEPRKEKEKEPIIIEPSFSRSVKIVPNVILKKEAIKLDPDSSDELIMQLRKKLKILNDNPSVNMVKSETNEDDDEEKLEINRLKYKQIDKNINRPPYLKIEKPQTITPNSFDESSIYEWNMDG